MKNAPLILISPSTQRKGVEFSDASISLSNRYAQAIFAAGGIPLIAPCTDSKELISEMVRRSDGVLLTGGDDVQPQIYAPDMPRDLAKKVGAIEPERDILELQMIDEVFRQQKPLLAICRGCQILNVALGGDLIVDIPTQVSGTLNHRRMDAKGEKVHDVTLTPGSLLASITGEQILGVNSTHHQAVGRVAGPLRSTAVSSDGVIEALELKKSGVLPYLLAVQFHPERLADRYEEFFKIFRSFVCASTSAKKI